MLIPTSYYSHHSYHGGMASGNDCQWEPLAAPTNSESYYQYVQSALEKPSEYFVDCIPRIYINNGGNGMSMNCCSSGPSSPESTSSLAHLPYGSSYSGPSSPKSTSSLAHLPHGSSYSGPSSPESTSSLAHLPHGSSYSGPSSPESTSSLAHLPHGSSYSGPSSPVDNSSCCSLDLYCNGGNSSSLPCSSPLPAAILQKDYTCVHEKEEKIIIKGS